tara:strand:+ start:199 stop:726 length:528 start_codon:yes stop_codon:yes gene_type:complete
MEAIALPGLKPANGMALDLATADQAAAPGGIALCGLGGAGYTEVLDDLIIEVSEAFVLSGGAQVATLSFGVQADGAASAPAVVVDTFNIHDLGKGVFSVLRGNDVDLAWEAAYNTAVLRTFGPGAVDADGVAVAARQGANTLTCTVTSTAGHWDEGAIRVYARTHYTAVNFGPGL